MGVAAPGRPRFLPGVAHAVAGGTVHLAADLLAQWPELGPVRWRRGGLPPRIGGWCLLAPSVDGVTVGRTVWLSPAAAARLDPELLLHEARHVQHWAADRLFPLRYIAESLRHGYSLNRYEIDARHYAAQRLAGRPLPIPPPAPGS